MLISLSAFCQHYQQSALLAVLCCHLATENVMNFATSQHGGGVCCAFAPQLVKYCTTLTASAMQLTYVRYIYIWLRLHSLAIYTLSRNAMCRWVHVFSSAAQLELCQRPSRLLAINAMTASSCRGLEACCEPATPLHTLLKNILRHPTCTASDHVTCLWKPRKHKHIIIRTVLPGNGRSAYFSHLVQWLVHHNYCANGRRGNYAANAVYI